MTVLVLESLAVLPAHTKGLRMMLARLARAIDALVSARASEVRNGECARCKVKSIAVGILFGLVLAAWHASRRLARRIPALGRQERQADGLARCLLYPG